MPIEYEDGRSSYRSTLEPIYLGLAELLLDAANQQPLQEQQATLKAVRDTLELTRQAELQDYLRDRCTVESAQGGALAEPDNLLHGTSFKSLAPHAAHELGGHVLLVQAD